MNSCRGTGPTRKPSEPYRTQQGSVGLAYDDASQVGPLLDQVRRPIASLTADGAYDQERVYAEVAARYPTVAVIIPPRANAVPGDTAETAPIQRDQHLSSIARHGRVGW